MSVSVENIPYTQIVISVLIPFAILLTQWAARKLILNIGQAKNVPLNRAMQVYRYFKAMIAVVWFVVLLVVWGIDYQALLVVASSVLAVIGVALVAQWSILSNITASIIVFFTMPAKVGDEIEIIDGSNCVKGVIREINFFNVLLTDDKGNEIAYPNNLILQRPVRKTVRENKTTELKSPLQKRLKER
jgi:small-conductance mechanosensitive channel